MKNKIIKEKINKMTKISKEICDEIVIEKFLEMNLNKKLDERVLERIILAHLSFFSDNDFYEYEKLSIYEKNIYFRMITQGMVSLYLNNKYLDRQDYRKKFQILDEITKILVYL